MKYDEKKEEIIIKIDNNEKHNIRFKLELKTKTYDFNKLKIQVSEIIDEMFNIQKKQKFEILINKLKEGNWLKINTYDFISAYDKIPDLEEMNISLTGQELYEEYKEIFDNTTWYHILKFDTSHWYQTIDDCKKALLMLSNKKITVKLYKQLCLKDKKLPINPDEFYKLQDFVSIEVNFNNNKKVICMC